MSLVHTRVVLSIPARRYFPHAVSSCGFAGVVRAVTFCNYCCNRIDFITPREMAPFLMSSSRRAEHDPTLDFVAGERIGTSADGEQALRRGGIGVTRTMSAPKQV